MASENEPKGSAPSLLGQKLRAFCEFKGSVRIVADALQITPQQLQKYVRGAQRPGADILSGLQQQGCSIDWLLDERKPLGSFSECHAPAREIRSERTPASPCESIDFDSAEFILGRPLERAAPQFGATVEEVQSWRSGVEPPLDKLVRLTNLILFLATDGRFSLNELDSRPGSRPAPEDAHQPGTGTHGR